MSPATCAAMINPHALGACPTQAPSWRPELPHLPLEGWTAPSADGGCAPSSRACADLSFPAYATYIRSMLLPRTNWIMRLPGLLRALGPYAAIELVLPGGTLIAVAVWAIRHRWSSAARAQRAADAHARASDLNEPAIAYHATAVSK